ncbi:MAG TPA: hypothetical protein VK750_08875 [Cytophagaceae bacterium]|jgi:hypothetical protein|nr:hypothetical protein [Cytophagaceae bacterium]
MPNKYPEHIDQLDDFYKSQLADHEVDAPDGLWDKINAGNHSAKKMTPSGLSTAQKLIGIGVIVLGLIAGCYYIYISSHPNNPSLDNNKIPATIEQPVEEDTHSSTTTKKENNNITPSPEKKTTNKNSSLLKHQEEEQQPIEKTAEENQKEEPTVIDNTPKEELKTDSTAAIKTVPKGKIKFKDKYKKEYQDSTSKIFIPGK